MTRLGHRSKDLLEQFRASERLDSHALERMQQGLFEKVARGETALAGIDPSPVVVPKVSWLAKLAGSSAAKLNTVLLVAAAGATTVWYSDRSQPQPASVVRVVEPPSAAPASQPQATLSAPEPVASPAAAPVVVHKPKHTRARRAPVLVEPEPEPEPAPPVPAAPEPPAPSNSPAQWHRVESPLDSELGLLRRAYGELNANRPERALEALKEHAYRFPQGELAEAREVAHMLALCGLEREPEAKARAAKFLAARPDSPFAGRVRGLCPVVLPKTDP